MKYLTLLASLLGVWGMGCSDDGQRYTPEDFYSDVEESYRACTENWECAFFQFGHPNKLCLCGVSYAREYEDEISALAEKIHCPESLPDASGVCVSGGVADGSRCNADGFCETPMSDRTEGE